MGDKHHQGQASVPSLLGHGGHLHDRHGTSKQTRPSPQVPVPVSSLTGTLTCSPAPPTVPEQPPSAPP